MNLLSVDHCVCHKVTFKSLLPIVKDLKDCGVVNEQDILNGICEQASCSSDCGTCEPYIRLMIQTGKTSFSPITPNKKR
jgi:bacterioferritin-associated ferredoxin